RGRGRKFGRFLDSHSLVPGVLLNLLDLLIALGLSTRCVILFALGVLGLRPASCAVLFRQLRIQRRSFEIVLFTHADSDSSSKTLMPVAVAPAWPPGGYEKLRIHSARRTAWRSWQTADHR